MNKLEYIWGSYGCKIVYVCAKVYVFFLNWHSWFYQNVNGTCDPKNFHIFFHTTHTWYLRYYLFFGIWQNVRFSLAPLLQAVCREETKYLFLNPFKHHPWAVSTASISSPYKRCTTRKLDNRKKNWRYKVLPEEDHLFHLAATTPCSDLCLCMVFQGSWLACPPVRWTWTYCFVSSSAQICLYPAVN